MSTNPVPADDDPLDVIEEEARAVAQFFGVKQCDVAAQMLTNRIAQRLGGRRVWLQGSSGRTSVRARDDRIRSKFNGHNHGELAAEEGLSERQVRRILRGHVVPLDVTK